MTTRDLLKAPDRVKLDQTAARCKCGHMALLHMSLDGPKTCFGRKGETRCDCRDFSPRPGPETAHPAVCAPSAGAPGRNPPRPRTKADIKKRADLARMLGIKC